MNADVLLLTTMPVHTAGAVPAAPFGTTGRVVRLGVPIATAVRDGVDGRQTCPAIARPEGAAGGCDDSPHVNHRGIGEIGNAGDVGDEIVLEVTGRGG
jgi:hypothetical protein